MKKLKDIIIIPKDGSAKIGTGDPNDLPESHIGIDLDLANRIREVTTVPIDTDDPKILAIRADWLRRHGIDVGPTDNTPKTEAGREYLENFKKIKSAKDPTIDENELKRLIADECEEKAKSEGRQFIWNNESTFMVRNMMYYFGNDPRGVWPYGKGLLLYGNVGVGKTWMFEIFQQIAYKYLRAGGKRFKMATCRKLYEEYTSNREVARDKYLKGNWCFDDLGNEPLEHKDYGNSVLPVEEILISRHSQFTAGHCFTHISTNLSLDEIRDRYGLRMFDRLLHMMHPVEWSGESKRK